METVGFDAVIAGYLAAYTDVTRTLYRGHINSWLSWCAENQIDPTRADRSHIEVYGRWLREMGRAKGTQASALNTICGLYRYAYETGYLDHDPGERVRRPRIVKHSAGTWLDRRQARDFLAVSRTMGARDAALCHLLLLNGPRIGEAVGLDVTDYHPGERPWARFRRKMDWMQDVALASAAAETLDAYIGDRAKGPIFLGTTRKRLTRDDANAIVAAVSRVRTYGDTRYRSNNSCWETSQRPMQSACLRPIAVRRHERSGTVTLSCVYRELSPCSPACTMTFASDWPWRMTYRSNGMPMVAPPELVDCRTDIDRVRTGRADPSRFHRSRTTARPGTFFRWACTEFTGGTCRVHLRHRDRADDHGRIARPNA